MPSSHVPTRAAPHRPSRGGSATGLLALGLALAPRASTAAPVPVPPPAVQGGQKAAWTGLGMSAAGSALVLTGSVVYYDGVLDAVSRNQGARDAKATDPTSAIASGLLVGGGLGVSAIGRPILSFGSALTAHRYQALGAPVRPTLGWVSVGAWAGGVGTFLAGRVADGPALDYAWLGLRGASFGTGLAQLVHTQRVMGRASATARAASAAPKVQLVVGPRGGAVVGRF